MHTETVTTVVTVVDTPGEAEQYLLSAGVQGPTLHPRKDTPDRGYWRPYRWSGANEAVACGTDAEGRYVRLSAWLYAQDGQHSIFGSVDGDTGRISAKIAFEGMTFPLLLNEVQAVIKHPEYTPGHPKALQDTREGLRYYRWEKGDDVVYFETWEDPIGHPGCDAEDDTCSGPPMLAAAKQDVAVGLCFRHATREPGMVEITRDEYDAADAS